MNAKEHLEAGQLAEAVAAQLDEVKKHPTDTARRGFLCELLCFSGDLERADKQLDMLGTQDPQAMVGVSMFRQLIRGETSRREFYTKGHVPEFLDLPNEVMQLHMQASIHLREGNGLEAAKLLAEAEEKRPKVSGTCDGAAFDDFRDLDDLTSSFAEVITSNGKYYWIPWERIEFIEFREISRPRDLLWRRAHMVVAGGPDGEVYFPTLYYGSHTDEDQRVRLGRVTDWKGGDGSPVLGIGQRTMLVGSEDKTILQLKMVEFDNPQSPSDPANKIQSLGDAPAE